MASFFPDVYLERRDHARNMARFYAVSIENDLLGDTVAVRRWGRIGTHGQSMRVTFPDTAQARIELLALVAIKCRRGYEPVSG